MGHPRMYEDSDPLLADLREVCLAMPGAGEKVAHGRPVWFTKNVFAIFGGSVKGDRGSMQLARALLFRPEPQEEQALMQDPRCHVPAYWARTAGWRSRSTPATWTGKRCPNWSTAHFARRRRRPWSGA